MKNLFFAMLACFSMVIVGCSTDNGKICKPGECCCVSCECDETGVCNCGDDCKCENCPGKTQN